MTLYAVYATNEDGSFSWIDSYWLNYENAVARFKKVWPYEGEPTKSEVKHHVRKITTQD
jgi:hypothetical protein